MGNRIDKGLVFRYYSRITHARLICIFCLWTTFVYRRIGKLDFVFLSVDGTYIFLLFLSWHVRFVDLPSMLLF